MSSSIDSTFESLPDRDRGPEFASLDPEKTVIRQDELLEVPGQPLAPDKPFSMVGFRQSASHLLGQQLDHFLIESLVGTGGMGAVFRGRDMKLDREVAIKVVPIADRGAEGMRRFRVEAQSAAKLDHPNIARVYYVGETDHWSYIVFEFVEGTNLRELVIKKGLLSIDDAVCLTRQVAEALQHAHERKVVHRDIKPSNILVTQLGQAKLVDMGLARTTELDKSTNDLTASGVTLGTFDYISPEQAHDPRQADVRSDIYSLGCTLYFLLTGQPPFPEGTALQKLLMHGTKMPEDPRVFRSDISDSMISILRKMMAKKPADRYQIPIDLIHDLRTLAELEGLVWASESDTTTNLPAAASRTWLEAFLPFLISLGTIFGITLWLQSSNYLSATFPIPRVEYPDVVVATSDAEPVHSPTIPNGIKTDPVAEAGPRTVNTIETIPQTAPDTEELESPRDKVRDTVVVDSEATDKDRGNLIVRTLEQAFEMVGSQSQVNKIVVKSPTVSTSVSALRATISIHSNLTIQSAEGHRCKWNIEGSETTSDSTSSLAWIECHTKELVLQDMDVVWRAGSLSRRRSLFSVRSNASLQFKKCTVTVQYDPNPFSPIPMELTSTQTVALPSVIVVDSGVQDSFGESNIGSAKLPARISCTQTSVRGQCDWMRMPSPVRTEVQMGNCWLAIVGSMFELNGNRNAVRSGMPLRMDFRNVTAYTQRSWMRVSMKNSQPFPVPFVRTAKDCIFSGSKSYIEWNASECDEWEVWSQSDEGKELSRWIDLRGRDNVYDATTLSDYLIVKLSNGSREMVALGANANLVAEELGLETATSWKKRPMIEPSRMHEATFDSLEWNRSLFRPGFQAESE
jgi:serine/threonine protein kinase